MAQLHGDMSGSHRPTAVISPVYIPSSRLSVFNISPSAAFPISASNSRCSLSSAAITRSAHRFPCNFNANWYARASSGSILRCSNPFASSDETQWLTFPRVVPNASASCDGLIVFGASKNTAASVNPSRKLSPSSRSTSAASASNRRAARFTANIGLSRKNASILMATV
jgi:hypothetical protein